MKPYKIRVTRLTVAPEGEPIFSEMATHVEIEDDAGGEYIQIRQIHDNAEPGVVGFEPDQWPLIKEAIDLLLTEIQP